MPIWVRQIRASAQPPMRAAAYSAGLGRWKREAAQRLGKILGRRKMAKAVKI